MSEWELITGFAQVVIATVATFVMPWARSMARDMHEVKEFMKAIAVKQSRMERVQRRHGLRLKRLEERHGLKGEE